SVTLAPRSIETARRFGSLPGTNRGWMDTPSFSRFSLAVFSAAEGACADAGPMAAAAHPQRLNSRSNRGMTNLLHLLRDTRARTSRRRGDQGFSLRSLIHDPRGGRGRISGGTGPHCRPRLQTLFRLVLALSGLEDAQLHRQLTVTLLGRVV